MILNRKKNIKDPMEEILLAIDYGETNIGLAFGRNGFVSPLTVISGKNDSSAISDIARYVIENKVDRVVMGLPLNSEGKETHQSKIVRTFSRLLKTRIKRPVSFENEYRTTADSKTEAFRLGISKKRRQTVDHFSAALILKSYYSHLQ